MLYWLGWNKYEQTHNSRAGRIVNNGGIMAVIPEEFSFEYQWQMGSVPPPYYYEYSIKVEANGAGAVELLPDYPMHHPVPRTLEINVGHFSLECLYIEMTKDELFEKECRGVDSNWGGESLSSLVVRAWGKEYKVPSLISSADRRRLEPVFLAIRELIPSQFLYGFPGLGE